MKIRSLIIGLLAVFTLPVMAQNVYRGCYSECDHCRQLCSDIRWCGNKVVFGEALIVRPASCSLGYIVQDQGFDEQVANEYFGISPQGKLLGSCPDFNWGFRLGVGYATYGGCYDGRIYYSRLHADEFDRHNAPKNGVIWPAIGPSDLLSFNNQGPSVLKTRDKKISKSQSNTGDEQKEDSEEKPKEPKKLVAYGSLNQQIDWDAIDIEVAARRMCVDRLWVRSHIGLQWTEIALRHNLHYQGTVPDLDKDAYIDVMSRSKTWGVGPRIGIDFHYDIWCDFGLTARVTGGILAGQISSRDRAKTSLEQINDDRQRKDLKTVEQEWEVSRKSQCAVFPEFNVAVGVHFLQFCGNCYTFLAEAGYQMETYLSAVPRSSYLDKGSGNNSKTCGPFSFNGFYIRAVAEF